MNNEYYYHDGNNQIGPLSIEQLKSVGLRHNTWVWQEGLDDWKPASEFKELKPLIVSVLIGFVEQGYDIIDPEEQLIIGEYYNDEKKNIPEACKWYERAAKQDHIVCQSFLGYYYLHGGTGFPANIDKSIEWNKKASENSNNTKKAEGTKKIVQNRLGGIYTGKFGIYNRFGTKYIDYAEAAKWYGKAADKGDKDAMFDLAMLHESPANAFPGCDIKIAVKLYEKLSNEPFNQNYAMIKLALLHFAGDNKKKGRELIEKSKLFKEDGKVQSTDEIMIYDLFQLGVEYCAEEKFESEESTLDDLTKGIALLEIVIDDGLKEFPPDRLELAKRCHDVSVKRRDNLIDILKTKSELTKAVSGEPSINFARAEQYIAKIEQGYFNNGAFSESNVKDDLENRRALDSYSMLGSSPRQTYELRAKKEFYFNDFNNNIGTIKNILSELQKYQPENKMLISKCEKCLNELNKLQDIVRNF